MRLALIGGSGVGELLGALEAERYQTRYGETWVEKGELAGVPLFFLARHGRGHTLPPHLVNYRANIAALAELGVTHVLATATVGSLRVDIPPGQWVVIDQFLDFTKNRPGTFAEEGRVLHTDFTNPYSPFLREVLIRKGQDLGLPLLPEGCYVCTEGPRYETAAEVRMFARLGGDVVGMTGVPEVVLAREAGLEYAAVALVTNYGAGLSAAGLHHAEVEARMAAKREELRRWLGATLPALVEAEAAAPT